MALQGRDPEYGVRRAIPSITTTLDNLEEEKRPASEDPRFSQLWQETGGEAEIISRTVKRWFGHTPSALRKGTLSTAPA